MNKKRLGRCDLNVLASRFEAIKEQERAQYVGGDWYYDCLGNPININGTHQVGTGNAVRILPAGASWEITGDGCGTLFSESTNASAKDAIIGSFLTSNYQGTIGTASSCSGNCAGEYTCSGQFNYNASHTAFDNYYQMQVIMSHENCHIDNNHCPNGSNITAGKNEQVAIEATIDSTAYKNTDYDFKMQMAYRLLDAWILQEESGKVYPDHTLAKAKEKCL